MASTKTTVSKVKLKESGNQDYSTFQIKDQWAREKKLDKDNPVGSGYMKLNGGEKAPGANSVSLGYRNNATGNCAAALGSQNEVAGEFSAAVGLKNKTLYPYQFVSGKFNLPLQEDMFEIGIGENENARANLFRITKDGNLYISGDILYNGMSDGDSISISQKIKTIEDNIIQNEYSLPKATKTSLGGVIVGDNIDIDVDGKISVTFPDQTKYKLPPATNESLGGIIAGENIQIAKDGTISVEFPRIPDDYVLPQATATELGGIKIAESRGFRLDKGVLTYAVDKMNLNNPEGTGSFKMNSSEAAGLYSASIGKSNIAESENSIALGKNNHSKGLTSITFGDSNNTNAPNAIAFGKESQATEENAIAGGIQATSAGSNAFSLGIATEANYENQFVIGRYNENKAENIFEIGVGSPGLRQNGLAITNTGDIYIDKDIYIHKADGDEYTNVFSELETLINEPRYKLPVASKEQLGGIKIGKNLSIDEDGVLNAADISNVFEDIDCKGSFSHNRVDTENIGYHSFASNSSALATNSTAFGENTQAGIQKTGTRQIWNEETQEWEEEEYTYIDGVCSFAEGSETLAAGSYSHAAGVGTIADQYAQFAIGFYNESKSNDLFEIGNGTDNNNRKNIFSVNRNGEIIISGELIINGEKVNPGSSPVIEIETQQEYDDLPINDKMKDIIYLIKENNKLYYKNVNYGGGSSLQSDWSETDEESDSFIKNKPLDLVHIDIDDVSQIDVAITPQNDVLMEE